MRRPPLRSVNGDVVAPVAGNRGLTLTRPLAPQTQFCPACTCGGRASYDSRTEQHGRLLKGKRCSNFWCPTHRTLPTTSMKEPDLARRTFVKQAVATVGPAIVAANALP